MTQRFRTRFTYHLNSPITRDWAGGPEVIAWPTDDYLDAINHTYSREECLRLDRAGTPMEAILFNATNRGWEWFTEDDYWFLRFILNVQHRQLQGDSHGVNNRKETGTISSKAKP